MIIGLEELDELEQYLSAEPESPFCQEFFASRSHLLLPLGFDQYRCIATGEAMPGSWAVRGLAHTPQSFYRRPTGHWCWMFGVFKALGRLTFGVRGGPFSDDEEFGFNRMTIGKQIVPSCAIKPGFNEALGADNVSFDDLLSKVREAARNPNALDISTVWSGALWTPSAQEEQRIHLRNCAVNLLKSLKAETTTLDDLTWRQLEDITVEILRSGGMEIHKMADSPQGGRDVIARMWLLGEPITLAVEVKHRSVVEPGHVRDAMYANQHFNGVIFVTSGRFASGVLRERSVLGSHLRLILKDGVALRDLIQQYPLLPRPAHSHQP